MVMIFRPKDLINPIGISLVIDSILVHFDCIRWQVILYKCTGMLVLFGMIWSIGGTGVVTKVTVERKEE